MVEEQTLRFQQPMNSGIVDSKVFQPDVLEHADTRDLVEDRFPFKVLVIPQLDRYPILKTGERNALLCDFQLLLTECDTMGLDTVMFCRMDDQRAPSAIDVQEAVPRPELELAAYVVELGLLGLLQIVAKLLEVGALVHHGLVQPQGVELVGYVIVKLDRVTVLRLCMGFDGTGVQR